jgi:hypothetical protein
MTSSLRGCAHAGLLLSQPASWLGHVEQHTVRHCMTRHVGPSACPAAYRGHVSAFMASLGPGQSLGGMCGCANRIWSVPWSEGPLVQGAGCGVG